MAELSIQDGSPRQETRAGQKRRAQSPPTADTYSNDAASAANEAAGGGGGGGGVSASASASASASSQQEPWQRNVMQLASGRSSQAPKLAAGQVANSLTSVASSSANPQNSYASSSSVFSLSQPGTAATSYASDRYSPSALQSAAAEAARPSSPGSSSSSAPHYGQGHALQTSHAQSMRSASPLAPPRRMSGSVFRAPGLWICDCCPKKPKKFDSEEELRIHEMEKQYKCQYCHNRFKNKNEAERHQNSLHLRYHSWSCAALTTFEAAFHPTPVNTLAVHVPGQDDDRTDRNSQQFRAMHVTATDTCGYCGQEFVNPPVWEDRIAHLNQTHKFGECNQSKKFFRADHFRQHLKHSHGGTSGKWTNMLEQACMKEEPVPAPLASGVPAVPNALPGGTPGIAMVSQQAYLAAAQLSQQNRQAHDEAQHQAQAALGQQDAQSANQFTHGDQSIYSPQFTSQMQQVQQYQPEQSQQGLNLAQHLQQAQREMAANETALEKDLEEKEQQ